MAWGLVVRVGSMLSVAGGMVACVGRLDGVVAWVAGVVAGAFVGVVAGAVVSVPTFLLHPASIPTARMQQSIRMTIFFIFLPPLILGIQRYYVLLC